MLEAEKAAVRRSPLPPARGGDGMTLANIWFVLVAFLLTGYVILDGFDLGAGVLYPFIARNEDEQARRPRLHRPGLGRQRGLAHHRRRRHLRRLPDGLRHDLQRLLPGHHARALRPDPARRVARVPPPRHELEQASGTAPSSSAAWCRRCSSASPWATSSAACPWTRRATTSGTFLRAAQPVLAAGRRHRACSCSSSTARRGSRSSRRASCTTARWRYRKVTFWICAVLAVATSLGDDPHGLARVGQRVRQRRSAGCSWSSSSSACSTRSGR